VSSWSALGLLGPGRQRIPCVARRLLEQRQYRQLPLCQPQQQRPDESQQQQRFPSCPHCPPFRAGIRFSSEFRSVRQESPDRAPADGASASGQIHERPEAAGRLRPNVVSGPLSPRIRGDRGGKGGTLSHKDTNSQRTAFKVFDLPWCLRVEVLT